MAIPNASIFSTSLEEVPVAVTPPIGINPTGSNPQFAFLLNQPPIQPTVGQYVGGTWQSTAAASTYTALCLVGPGGATQLAQGQYNVWLKITASPEIPVKWCGILQVS